MKVLLTGGGTLGPVTPLLGLVEHWRAHNESLDLVWVGTVKGPEGPLVSANDIRFISIAGVKAPRYFTFYWFIVPFIGVYALIESWNLLKNERPDAIVTAGGFVSVPLIILGRFMGIPSWVHQQDVVPGLANKIMAKFAKRISVTFEKSRDVFPSSKTETMGNAVRKSIGDGDRIRGYKKFNLDPDRKTILVMGGGGGSSWINESVSALAVNLTEHWQVLHSTGSDKYESVQVENHNYVVEPMIHDAIDDAYAIADLVICRAGLGTLTELAFVGKPAIVIPMPDSHQEMNAFELFEHQAAIVLDQTETTPQILLNTIKSIVEDENSQMRLVANLKLTFPKDGTKKIADGVLAMAGEAAKEWKRGEAKKIEKHVEEMFGGEDELEFELEAGIGLNGSVSLHDEPGGAGSGSAGVAASQAPRNDELEDSEFADDELENDGMSIKEQVERALKGQKIEIEEAGDDSPFEVKDV